MENRERAITLAVTNDAGNLNISAHDFWTLGPDDIRDRVQSTLSTLCEAEGKGVRNRLLKGLTKAGVHISSSIFMLGIPATCPDELTPSDMGKLLRYVRINSPSAIEALAVHLAELLTVNEGPLIPAQEAGEAA